MHTWARPRPEERRNARQRKGRVLEGACKKAIDSIDSLAIKKNNQNAWVYAIMPTVDRIDGLRVVIYPNDHRPAHVHVIGDCEAVFKLNCPEGPPELRENYGFAANRLSRIQAALTSRLTHLCAEWSRIHGLP